PDPSLRHTLKARNEVWGLAWHSPERFTGLAYCVGGRSLYWGGWSPRFLDSEMPTVAGAPNLWPATVVEDLKARFFEEANRQLGANESNDFIAGALHEAMRTRLLKALDEGGVATAFPVDELPLQVTDPPIGDHVADAAHRRRERKLDAPYAINTATRPGFFPFNKFSSLPLLMAAARDAAARSGGDDNRKRLMVVPNCHVTGLDTEPITTATGAMLLRVRGVHTNLGYVPVRRDGPTLGVVVLAAAAIESTRLALLSFQGLADQQYAMIGKNLMAHTRANLFFRIPRSRLEELGVEQQRLEVSALQVRGRRRYDDGTVGHYHIQVTASGTPNDDANVDRELFQKVPDLDHYRRFVDEELDEVVPIAIRAIAEMQPHNPGSFVRLDQETDEFGMPRAFVGINQQTLNNTAINYLTEWDRQLFDTMCKAMVEVARVFDPELENPDIWVDPLGSTHHEAGTLWMGDDPQRSVTNPYGRFHGVANAFVADLSVLPTVGSANPMLPGIALTRRLAKHLVPEGDGRLPGDPTPIRPYQVDPEKETPVTFPELAAEDSEGFQPLFDGRSIAFWRMAGKGQPFVVGDSLQLMPGNDLGLLWCTIPTPADFVLRLEWFLAPRDDAEVFVENSGVFVRFPHPDSKGFHNPAWVPVFHGFEIQIDPQGRAPDGRLDVAEFRTGAVYSFAGPDHRPDAPAGRWNRMEIRAQGQTYHVSINDQQTAEFTYDGDDRGQPSTDQTPRYIGVQAYGGAKAAFRNIRIKQL
ncbi:MAG: DUF1080 domain-containing protein, partial [Actinomycetota bacterium]|nr:DUF1080 domain-containing protein [Actinomycetota bacterium]